MKEYLQSMSDATIEEPVALEGAAHLLLAAGVAALHPAELVLEAMLEGWTAQQRSRNLTAATIEDRLRLARRFVAFTNEYPWQWRRPIWRIGPPRRRPEPGADPDGAQEPPQEVVDRLAGLLPEGAFEDAVKGLQPEELSGPGGLLSQLAGRVVEAARPLAVATLSGAQG